jgi:hypothetical protein
MFEALRAASPHFATSADHMRDELLMFVANTLPGQETDLNRAWWLSHIAKGTMMPDDWFGVIAFFYDVVVVLYVPDGDNTASKMKDQFTIYAPPSNNWDRVFVVRYQNHHYSGASLPESVIYGKGGIRQWFCE